jgi:hypothetical protein
MAFTSRADSKMILHFANEQGIPMTNLDCGGKRSATPLFRARTDYRTLLVIRKRRRHFVLPAQSIKF